MSQSFVNLHTHSFYSILAGTMLPKQILEVVQKNGFLGVALTDRGVGYGFGFYGTSR